VPWNILYTWTNMGCPCTIFADFFLFFLKSWKNVISRKVIYTKLKLSFCCPALASQYALLTSFASARCVNFATTIYPLFGVFLLDFDCWNDLPAKPPVWFVTLKKLRLSIFNVIVPEFLLLVGKLAQFANISSPEIKP
jgi:hypothetical protein